MTKRRVFLLIGFVALVGLVLSELTMLPPTPGVTKANFERIQYGMTMAEVENIFGDNVRGALVALTTVVPTGKDLYGHEAHFR